MSFDYTQWHSDMATAMDKLNESFDSIPDLTQPTISAGEKQVIDELKQRREQVETLIKYLDSQVIALDRAARAAERHADSAEEQVMKIQGMLEASYRQADAAELQARSSEESAKKSHRWFVASSIAAVFSALGAMHPLLRELLTAFLT